MKRLVSVLIILVLALSLPVSVLAEEASKPDLTKLNKYIAEYEKLNPKDWNSRLFLYLELDVKAAKELIASGEYTEAQVNRAWLDIADDLQNLEPKPELTPVEVVNPEDFGKVDSLYPEDYTGMMEGTRAPKDPVEDEKTENNDNESDATDDGDAVAGCSAAVGASAVALCALVAVIGTVKRKRD